MIKPTIHRNGTSREELLKQVTDAGAAIRNAIKAMVDAEPNGRDYYVQGGSVIHQAMSEHVDRVSKLTEVLHEYEMLAEHISDAGTHR